MEQKPSTAMTPRERVLAMLDFKSVDKPALECDVNSVALYEHGEKIRELFKTLPGDFGPITDNPFYEKPGADVFDRDGRMWLPREGEDFDERGDFLRDFIDDWGVEWRYRIFGIQGHPKQNAIKTWQEAERYKFPDIIPDPIFSAIKADVEKQQAAGYFVKRGWVNYMERTYSLYNFEDVLMDIATRDAGLLRFTERFHEHNVALTKRWLDAGVDAVQLADDFGTQSSLLISRESFRDIYLPYYKELCSIIHAAGKKAFYHVCGYVEPLLEDFAEIGFDTIWPQVNVYDLPSLAKQCRSLGIAIAIHPDRSDLMTNGKPSEIEREIDRYYEIFRPDLGGSWFYLEIDNGFPFENIEAMVNAVKKYR